MGLKKRLGIYIMFICLIANCLPMPVAKAASATVTISLKENEIMLHDTFTVVVNVAADESIGGFEAVLTYDDKYMEFLDGGNNVNGGEGILRISDLDPENIVTSRKYVLQFKAIKQGNAQIDVLDQAYVYTFEDSAEMSVSSNNLSINIKTDEKVSSNNTLYSLRISPGKLSPDFDAKTTSYTTEVENDVNEVVVSAIAQDADAKVETKGTNSLQEGLNEATITVTAPSGKQKTYTIEITKKSIDDANEETEEQEKTLEEIKKEEDFKNLQQNGYLVSKENDEITFEFDAKYTVVPLEDITLIPEGYESTTMLLNEIEIPVYEKIGEESSEYLLIYMKGKDGVPRYYQYNKVDNTVQRYDENNDRVTDNKTHTMTKDEYIRKLNNMKILVAISCAIALVATLIVVRLLIKNHGIKDDDL